MLPKQIQLDLEVKLRSSLVIRVIQHEKIVTTPVQRQYSELTFHERVLI